jgi:hypothetical protein
MKNLIDTKFGELGEKEELFLYCHLKADKGTYIPKIKEQIYKHRKFHILS